MSVVSMKIDPSRRYRIPGNGSEAFSISIWEGIPDSNGDPGPVEVFVRPVGGDESGEIFSEREFRQRFSHA